MNTNKYAPGERPPSGEVGDTSRYPTAPAVNLPKPPLPTDVPSFMKETAGYMDEGCSSEMVK